MNPVANATEVDIAPTTLNGVPASDVQAELDRVLKSRVFIHSHRIRRFLQFVVEECLYGRQHRLKEYLIGLEVFNRHDDFDPRVDSIVRVEARRLRAKIEEYYQTEGHENEIRIELRKGSYVPIFERSAGSHFGYSGNAPLGRRHSIALVPFAAREGDAQLVGGIIQELSHALLKGTHFKVLADGNGSPWNSLNGGPTRSNGAAKPDYLLECRIEKHGDGSQVFLQLMNVKDRAYVWSEYDDLANIEHLAGSLNRAMTPAGFRPENGHHGTKSSQPESFDLYLQGRYQWRLAAPESFGVSQALFSQSVSIQPNYAAAWAAMAEASLLSAVFGFSDPGESAPQKHSHPTLAREGVEKALALNALLPEAHVALAALQSVVDWDWLAGERSCQRAIRLAGGNATFHLVYGLQLACRGMWKLAMNEVECSLELDPASLPVNFVLGWLLGAGKRYDDAIAQHTTVARLAPDFPLSYVGLGWAHLGKGQYSDALAHFSNARNLMRSWPMLAGCLGHCYAQLDQHAEAHKQLEYLNQSQVNRLASRVSIAAIQAGLGYHDDALGNLETAADSRDCCLPLQLLNPEFDAVRHHPRFTALMERMGLKRAHSFAMPLAG